MDARTSHNMMALVRAVVSDRDLQARFQNGERDAVFDEYGLTKEQREQLAQPSWENLAAAGIPPVAQIGFMLYTFPPLFQTLNMQKFLPRLIDGDHNPVDQHLYDEA